MGYFYLSIAIITEVIATSALKASSGFTLWLPSIFVVLGYSLSFYYLALSLNRVPIGIAYTIWGGVGIVLINLIGWLFFKQVLDAAAIIGIALILAGVVVIQLASNTAQI